MYIKPAERITNLIEGLDLETPIDKKSSIKNFGGNHRLFQTMLRRFREKTMSHSLFNMCDEVGKAMEYETKMEIVSSKLKFVNPIHAILEFNVKSSLVKLFVDHVHWE